MKTALSLLVTLVLATTAAAARQSAPPPIVKAYLDIQNALASDRFDDVKAPARALATEAAALGGGGAALAKAASAVEGARDLAAAREAFGPLSEAMIARAREEGWNDLRVGYCPMARRSWLQRDEQVRNPYYGKQMLACGELKPLGADKK